MSPITSLIKNCCLKKLKFSSGFAPLKDGKENKFLSFSGLVSAIVTFMSNKNVLYEFPQKCFKTTERHSLVVFGTLCGKIFFFFFSHFTAVIKNICLNKSKFSSGFAPLKQGKKTNFLNISVLVSAIVTFNSKKKSSL